MPVGDETQLCTPPGNQGPGRARTFHGAWNHTRETATTGPQTTLM
jgi:hypothetical protein